MDVKEKVLYSETKRYMSDTELTDVSNLGSSGLVSPLNVLPTPNSGFHPSILAPGIPPSSEESAAAASVACGISGSRKER